MAQKNILIKNVTDSYNPKDISFHLLHHIVDGIKVHGPVQGAWMFPFERYRCVAHIT